MLTKSISVWPVPKRLYACPKQYLNAQGKLPHHFVWWAPAASHLAYAPTQPGGALGPPSQSPSGDPAFCYREVSPSKSRKHHPSLVLPGDCSSHRQSQIILLLKSAATDTGFMTWFETLVPGCANRFCKLGLAWNKCLSIPGGGENCF